MNERDRILLLHQGRAAWSYCRTSLRYNTSMQAIVSTQEWLRKMNLSHRQVFARKPQASPAQ